MGIVPVEEIWIVHGCNRGIQIAILVEVRQGDPVAYPTLIETPFPGNLRKRNSSFITEDEVLVFFRGGVSPKVSLRFRRFECFGLFEKIRIRTVLRHPVGSDQINPTIVVKITELDRPGPVGPGKTRHVGNFQEGLAPGIQVE